jgi:hypothetical protein
LGEEDPEGSINVPPSPRVCHVKADNPPMEPSREPIAGFAGGAVPDDYAGRGAVMCYCPLPKERGMKQQIVCPVCEPRLKRLFPTENPYPGEHVKFVKGLARQSYFCDHCGGDIPIYAPCCAHSIWSDHGAQPYSPWENDYISPLPDAKEASHEG